MKKWIVFILAAIAAQAQADDFAYKYLVFTNTQGQQTALATPGLAISVADGYLTATNDEGDSASFLLTQLASMAFATTAPDVVTAIEPAVTAIPTGQGSIEAFNLSGQRLGTFATMSQLKEQLGHGVYIVKQNGTTKKIILK